MKVLPFAQLLFAMASLAEAMDSTEMFLRLVEGGFKKVSLIAPTTKKPVGSSKGGEKPLDEPQKPLEEPKKPSHEPTNPSNEPTKPLKGPEKPLEGSDEALDELCMRVIASWGLQNEAMSSLEPCQTILTSKLKTLMSNNEDFKYVASLTKYGCIWQEWLLWAKGVNFDSNTIQTQWGDGLNAAFLKCRNTTNWPIRILRDIFRGQLGGATFFLGDRSFVSVDSFDFDSLQQLNKRLLSSLEMLSEEGSKELADLGLLHAGSGSLMLFEDSQKLLMTILDKNASEKLLKEVFLKRIKHLGIDDQLRMQYENKVKAMAVDELMPLVRDEIKLESSILITAYGVDLKEELFQKVQEYAKTLGGQKYTKALPAFVQMDSASFIERLFASLSSGSSLEHLDLDRLLSQWFDELTHEAKEMLVRLLSFEQRKNPRACLVIKRVDLKSLDSMLNSIPKNIRTLFERGLDYYFSEDYINSLSEETLESICPIFTNDGRAMVALYLHNRALYEEIGGDGQNLLNKCSAELGEYNKPRRTDVSPAIIGNVVRWIIQKPQVPLERYLTMCEKAMFALRPCNVWLLRTATSNLPIKLIDQYFDSFMVEYEEIKKRLNNPNIKIDQQRCLFLRHIGPNGSIGEDVMNNPNICSKAFKQDVQNFPVTNKSEEKIIRGFLESLSEDELVSICFGIIQSRDEGPLFRNENDFYYLLDQLARTHFEELKTVVSQEASLNYTKEIAPPENLTFLETISYLQANLAPLMPPSGSGPQPQPQPQPQSEPEPEPEPRPESELIKQHIPKKYHYQLGHSSPERLLELTQLVNDLVKGGTEEDISWRKLLLYMELSGKYQKTVTRAESISEIINKTFVFKSPLSTVSEDIQKGIEHLFIAWTEDEAFKETFTSYFISTKHSLGDEMAKELLKQATTAELPSDHSKCHKVIDSLTPEKAKTVLIDVLLYDLLLLVPNVPNDDIFKAKALIKKKPMLLPDVTDEFLTSLRKGPDFIEEALKAEDLVNIFELVKYISIQDIIRCYDAANVKLAANIMRESKDKGLKRAKIRILESALGETLGDASELKVYDYYKSTLPDALKSIDSNTLEKYFEDWIASYAHDTTFIEYLPIKDQLERVIPEIAEEANEIISRNSEGLGIMLREHRDEADLISSLENDDFKQKLWLVGAILGSEGTTAEGLKAAIRDTISRSLCGDYDETSIALALLDKTKPEELVVVTYEYLKQGKIANNVDLADCKLCLNLLRLLVYRKREVFNTVAKTHFDCNKPKLPTTKSSFEHMVNTARKVCIN